MAEESKETKQDEHPCGSTDNDNDDGRCVVATSPKKIGAKVAS
jgi:hypothetical protein